MKRKTIVFLSSNEPDPTIIRKLNLLNSFKYYDIRLIYWHRINSNINKLLVTELEQDSIYRICLPEPRGNLVRRFVYYSIFFLNNIKKISNIKPHAIHANNLDMLIIAFILKMFNQKIKLILDLLDTRSFYLKKLWKLILHPILKKTDIIFISSPKYLDDFLLKITIQLHTDKVEFVPNAPLKSEFENFKKKNDNFLTIGYIGAFRGQEAINKLVETVYQLNELDYKINILFAGMGKDKFLVEKHNKKFDFVEYTGIYNYKNELKKLYEKVDLIYSIYNLSHNKKIHLSCRLSDAIVCGLPIIVQDNTYQSELVKKYNIGYIIEFGKWDQLKNLLSNIYSNRRELNRKSNNCKMLLKKNIFETYEQLIIKKYNSLFI